MPLYSIKKIDSSTTLAIWKIEEDFDSLLSSVTLNSKSMERLEVFSSDKRKLEFLATRNLFTKLGLSDSEVTYRDDGAPIIKDGYISISHTSEFVAVIISGKRVGVDIERKRKQLFRITNKFINDNERSKFDVKSLEILSVIWNSKEAMFKLCRRQGIDFRQNMNVTGIDFETKDVVSELIFDDKMIQVKGKLDIFGNHTLVYLMKG